MTSTTSGTGHWVPTADQIGEHTLTLVKSDSRPNGVTRKEVTVTVAASNTIPVLLNAPPLTALVGDEVIFDADGFDADGNEITYSGEIRSASSIQTIRSFDNQ